MNHQQNMRAIEKLYRNPVLPQQSRFYMLHRYVDLARQSRQLNISQWETAHALVDSWHGTPEDLAQAARELA